MTLTAAQKATLTTQLASLEAQKTQHVKGSTNSEKMIANFIKQKSDHDAKVTSLNNDIANLQAVIKAD